MEIKNLQIDKAPEKGYMLAYIRDKVIFEKYEDRSQINVQLSSEDILEIHLFDSDFEYRALSSVSKRFSNGIIEAVIDFEPNEDAYCVDTIVDSKDDIEKTGLKNMKVLNHISYDNNGVAYIDNYRLIPGGGLNGI